jgi:hypothetical protein|tara:strand:- start:226 stop:618 length:393 start_codon:yes stop_codon:yes gene_type:complete
MLSYYISQSNEFVIRTENTQSIGPEFTSSEDLTLVLDDMLTHTITTYPLPTSSYDWNPYENIFTFSQSLENVVRTGQEFLVDVSGSISGSIFRGSMQVYASQSIDKVVYTTQNDKFVSNVTDNEYIVLND